MAIKRVTKQQAKKYVSDFAKYLQVEKKLPVIGVYLYGSYARDGQRDWSDIDVAIVSDRFKGKTDPLVYLGLSRRKLDIERGLEPVGFHPRDFVMENPLAAEIKMNGEKIEI